MMQTESTKMSREDRNELECNIKELKNSLSSLSQERKDSNDPEIKDGLGVQIMTRLKELQNLRRLRSGKERD